MSKPTRDFRARAGPGRWLHSDALLERGLVFVAAASMGGLALALAGAFKPWLVWLLAILATAIYHWTVRPTPASRLGLQGWHVLAVMALALLFRVPPYQYVLGGQDPGVYTNVSTYLLRTGGIEVDDPESATSEGRLDPILAGHGADQRIRTGRGIGGRGVGREHLTLQRGGLEAALRARVRLAAEGTVLMTSGPARSIVQVVDRHGFRGGW